jgi:hypothetical protein
MTVFYEYRAEGQIQGTAAHVFVKRGAEVLDQHENTQADNKPMGGSSLRKFHNLHRAGG